MSSVELAAAMTMGSLFDGIGGFPLGAARYGIKTIWAGEIEPFPMEVTKRRFPSINHEGDITKLSGKLLFRPDYPAPAPAFLWSRSALSRRCAQRNGSAAAQEPISAPAL